MRNGDRKWLELIALASKGSGMYAGERADLIPPSVALRLQRDGFVYLNIPHNPVHKERLTITSDGLRALEG
jgi:hypothetical protein